MNAFKTRNSLALLLTTALIAGTSPAVAKVALPQVFGSHMVLQAGVELPVWGTADPGEEVTVRFAGQEIATAANAAGEWSVKLAKCERSATAQMMIVAGDNEIILEDVLIGEVWVCAGQSNMEFPLKQAANAKAALKGANLPTIRLLNLRGAARGGSGEYTPAQIERLTQEAFCRGSWKTCTAETAGDFSAVGYFFGRKLNAELDTPIGLISPAIGGTPAEAWIRCEAMAGDPRLATLVEGNWLENVKLDQWCQRRAKANLRRATDAGEAIPGDELGPNHSFKVGFMWEAGIKPLIPYAIRGVIWYQGESNAATARRAEQHREIFPRLVEDWRAQWGQGDFPFYYVQLPALGRPNWPLFREGQRRFLEQLPNVGMAVTIDVGHPTNVHPTSKQPVGERLARLALAGAYVRNLVPTGPMFCAWKSDGNQATIQFENTGKRLVTTDGEPPRGFEAAGSDGAYHPATAKLAGSSVKISCEQCDSIEYIRYGWSPYPTPPLNLINDASLPASPFSTGTPD